MQAYFTGYANSHAISAAFSDNGKYPEFSELFPAPAKCIDEESMWRIDMAMTKAAISQFVEMNDRR